MSKPYDRRQVLKSVAAASASFLLPKQSHRDCRGNELIVAGLTAGTETGDVEVQVVGVSPHTLRFTVLPIKNGQVAEVPSNGSMLRTSLGEPILKLRGEAQEKTVKSGNLRVNVSTSPLSFTVETETGEKVQNVIVEPGTGVVHFNTGNSPLLGLGEGGPQFDRRGSIDA